MKKLASIVLCVILAPAAVAQNTLLIREEGRRGASSSLSVGAITPKIEVWGFGINSDYPDYELGRLHPVKAGDDCLLVGGYLVWWPKTEDWFVLPWVTYETQVGKTCFHTDQAYYLPLAGGPEIWFSNDTSVNWQVNSKITVSLSAHWWKQEGLSCPVRFGPKVVYRLTDKVSLVTRYCPWGGNTPDGWRVETCITF